MRNNRGSLHARIDAIEQKLISPLDKRIQQLDQYDRVRFEQWREQCREQFKTHETEPGNFYKLHRNGDLSYPELPRHIENLVFHKSPELPAGATASELRHIWDNRRRAR